MIQVTDNQGHRTDNQKHGTEKQNHRTKNQEHNNREPEAQNEKHKYETEKQTENRNSWKWSDGIWLGIREEPNEAIIGTREGIVNAMSIIMKASQSEN